MKSILKISFSMLALFCLASFSSAQNTGIIPTPQKVEMTQGQYVCESADKMNVIAGIVPSLPIEVNADQGYVIEVKPDFILIQATTEVGLFYGRQSVKQLADHFADENGRIVIPAMHIVDYPALKYRGWMDDISRGPIVNMAFLKRMISTMAEYKMNFFNLYTEHVFKLEDYYDIAPSDGLTAEEIKELEEFAAQYHIEFFGNQQCLAHAEKTLRIPYYQEMADTKANWNPEKSKDFLKYELETVAKAYSSPFFNINCDETEALGSGKAHDYVTQHGASQVYADHIRWVYDVLKPLGKRVMMWGDIAAKDSAITAQLPKDMLMIVWAYSPLDSYASMIEPFKKQGLEFMVAPGMSMWGSVFPSYDLYTKNIANLVRDGYQHGALGVMNTAWDDSGESLVNSAWHGMCWAAEMAWNPLEFTEPKAADQERNLRLKVFNTLFEERFAAPTDHFQLMRDLEHVNVPNFFNSGALYESIWDFYPTKVSEENFRENLRAYDLIGREMDQYEYKGQTDVPQFSAPMRIAHYVAWHQLAVAKRNILRHEIYQYLKGNQSYTKGLIENEIRDEIELLHVVKRLYLSLWDEENRPYSRDIVEKRYDKVAQELLNIPYHVHITYETNEAGETVVSMQTLYDDVDIYYTLDGRKPQVGENRYTAPFVLPHSATIRAMTRNAMNEDVITERYVLIHKGLGKISKLNSKYSNYRPEYAASGEKALADGLLGGESYADGNWQGYWGNDIDVEFDFGKKTALHTLKIRFLQNIHDWIMAPNTVEVYVSKDGRDYTLAKTVHLSDVDYNIPEQDIRSLHTTDLALKARFVRVVVKNAGPLPEWHISKGQPSYLFCDEIIWD
ncbi:MAG: chitobiase/beta-hexosaminidase C-terminal domain-containing protein [Bacteroidales bacterium]|nr:chitobiase/beta-hexosaminidase C-terminal domain-containing protein [Bacteroidales bacterium]